jgi:mannose-6-phosphate isomerase-like protein (cupin superfamily)
MARGTLIRPSQVKPFVTSPKYTSRMLLDHTNSESKKTHINHGTLAPGAALLPPSAHGTPDQHYDETYIIMKGKCKLVLDGEVLDIQEGDIIFIPGGVYHGLDNTGGKEEVQLLTVWAGVPPKGINEAYDMRMEQWGKSYKTVDED